MFLRQSLRFSAACRKAGRGRRIGHVLIVAGEANSGAQAPCRFSSIATNQHLHQRFSLNNNTVVSYFSTAIHENDAIETIDRPVGRWSQEEIEQETVRLLSLLPSQREESDTTNIQQQVNLSEHDEVFEAWSSLAAKIGIAAADRAAELLEALELNMNTLAAENNRIQWNVAWYNNVMHAYAVCAGGRQAAEKAEAILHRMLMACLEYNDDNKSQVSLLAPPEPTTRSFNTVINAWAKSGEEDSGQCAENIFTGMEYWQLECENNPTTEYTGAAPNARTLSGVMDAWAQSGASGAEERALHILMHAIDKQRASIQVGGPPVEGTVMKPNVIIFNSAIHAWVNSKRGLAGAEKAEEILRLLERLSESGELGEIEEYDNDDEGLKPNTRTLSLVIDAWAQCESSDKTGAAAKRAQDILNTMERLYREGHSVKPSSMAFTSCIAAWSRSVRNPDAAAQAEALLDRMLALYNDTGDKDFKPTVVTGNAVISAWAKSENENSAERAEAVFKRLKDFCEPDTYSYNSVINAHAKRGEGLIAKRLLRQMEDACNNGRTEACPDRVTYNTVIYALSKSSRRGSAQEAEELLEQMKSLEKEGRSEFKPTPTTYTTVITAWGRSKHPRQAEKAQQLLRAMIDGYKAGDATLKPDFKTFTATINACARYNVKHADQKRSALKIAIQTFEEMRNSPDYDNPNEVTYRALMKSCNQCSTDPAERSRLLRSTFQQCCQDGMVSKLVLATLREGVSRNDYAAIVGHDRTYPFEWSRNVSRRHRP